MAVKARSHTFVILAQARLHGCRAFSGSAEFTEDRAVVERRLEQVVEVVKRRLPQAGWE